MSLRIKPVGKSPNLLKKYEEAKKEVAKLNLTAEQYEIIVKIIANLIGI